jgi:hypothetical protein
MKKTEAKKSRATVPLREFSLLGKESKLFEEKVPQGKIFV